MLGHPPPYARAIALTPRLPHLLIVAALVLAALTFLAPGPAHAADKDCGDFATQKAAQDFFLANGGPQKDPHHLDADGDGIACESLPCPCSTSQSSGDGGGDSTPAKAFKQYGKVVKVVDGDTFDVRLKSGKKERVRILGIDTPEVYGGEECMGPEASKKAKKTFPQGAKVILLSDPTQDLEDAYDRLLRYTTRVKGKKDWGKVQLKAGLARVYVHEKPFKRVKEHRKLEKQAKEQKLGLWGAC